MCSFRNIAGLTAVWLGAAVALPALAHEEQVLLVGRTAAGELRGSHGFCPTGRASESIFPGIPGFATGELAFHSTVLDEPDEDLFQLSTAADFRFVPLTNDPAWKY